VKQKYFRPYRNQNWAFTGEGTSRDGREKRSFLLYAKAAPIERHVKVTASANPYDP
jgi:RNA-directed DNA polymerase